MRAPSTSAGTGPEPAQLGTAGRQSKAPVMTTTVGAFGVVSAPVQTTCFCTYTEYYRTSVPCRQRSFTCVVYGGRAPTVPELAHESEAPITY